ncbi:MAG: alanine racemase [Elusimicrobiota bacterium]
MAQLRRFFRPTWAEVDLARLAENIRRFRAKLSPRTELLFVVKANAYGHGAVACAKTAARAGARRLGVSSVEEGILLREAGLKLPILVLGSLYPFESFLAGAEYRLTPTVSSFEAAARLAAAARRLGRPVACHLKIDTGMGRIGMTPKTALQTLEYLRGEKAVRVEGIYTHLSCADSDPAFTRRQLALFRGALSAVARAGLRVPLRHAANSAAALRLPASRLDLVRPGLALYGLYPGFSPILTLKTKVVFLKTVPAGAPISYGAAYRARRPSRIATVPVGYADGVPRRLSDKGSALLGGRRCPIVGKITMDMMMLDVSAVPEARVGDDVVLIGRQGREQLPVEELAKTLGTIPYEVTTSLSSRVPRVYLS